MSAVSSESEYELSEIVEEKGGAGAVEITEDNAADLLFTFCDQLTDRAAEKRIKALQECGRVMSVRFVPEVATFRETLLTAVDGSLRRGSPVEKLAALAVLELFVITMGGSATAIYPHFRPLLVRLIKDEDAEVAVKAEAVRCFALLSFICDESIDHISEDLKVCYDLFEGTAAQVATAGIQGWSLILTTLSSETIRDSHLDEALILLRDILPLADLVKSNAIGELLAYLFEVARRDEDFDPDNLVVPPEEIVQALDSLAAQKSRRQSKKDLKDKRRNFRRMSDSIRTAQAPQLTLVINCQQFSFDTWEHILQINSLRTVLKSGFQTHFHYNDLLHDIFEVRIEKGAVSSRLTALEKKQFMSKNSSSARDRTESRARDRDRKFAR